MPPSRCLHFLVSLLTGVIVATGSLSPSSETLFCSLEKASGICKCTNDGLIINKRISKEETCPLVFPDATDQVTIYTTTQAGKRWEKSTVLASIGDDLNDGDDLGTDDETEDDDLGTDDETEDDIDSLDSLLRGSDDSEKLFHTPYSEGGILGFGGAFTDAAAHNLLEKLDYNLTREVLRGYFSQKGLHYTTGRTHMGSIDFSRRSYQVLPERGKLVVSTTRNGGEMESYYSLDSFLLEDDRNLNQDIKGTSLGATILLSSDYKVDLISLANETAILYGSSKGITHLFFAPWSPPGWMKKQVEPGTGTDKSNKELLANNLKKAAALKKTALKKAALNPFLPQNESQNEDDVIDPTPENVDPENVNTPKGPKIWFGLQTADTQASQDDNLRATEQAILASTLYGGKLIQNPLVKKTYAKLFVKYVQEYAKHGINFWGISAQNEAWVAQPTSCLFESCHYEPKELADFVENYLGPTLEENNLSYIKLFGYDDMIPSILDYYKAYGLTDSGSMKPIEPQSAVVSQSSSSPEAPSLASSRKKRYVSGLGFHWYFSFEGRVENTTNEVMPDYLRELPFMPNQEYIGGGAAIREIREQLNQVTMDHRGEIVNSNADKSLYDPLDDDDASPSDILGGASLSDIVGNISGFSSSSSSDTASSDVSASDRSATTRTRAPTAARSEHSFSDYTDFFLLPTEACTGVQADLYFGKGTTRDPLDGWLRGYFYARDIFYQLSNSANGWTDWNLALDADGGPNHVGNRVDAPVLVSNENTEFLLNPMYYAIGHFSHFLLPGSKPLKIKRGMASAKPIGLLAVKKSAPVKTALIDLLAKGNTRKASGLRRKIEKELLAKGKQETTEDNSFLPNLTVHLSDPKLEAIAYLQPNARKVALVILNGPYDAGTNKVRDTADKALGAVDETLTAQIVNDQSNVVLQATWQIEKESFQSVLMDIGNVVSRSGKISRRSKNSSRKRKKQAKKQSLEQKESHVVYV